MRCCYINSFMEQLYHFFFYSAIEVMSSLNINRIFLQKQLHSVLAYLLMGCKCIEGASTELCFYKANEFVQSISLLLKNHVDGENLEPVDAVFFSHGKY